MDQPYDSYYSLYNTKSIENFINQTNENCQIMFMAHDLQIKFLNSKILQLENEIEKLKINKN